MVVLIGCSYIARTTVANYIQRENINTNVSRHSREMGRSWLYIDTISTTYLPQLFHILIGYTGVHFLIGADLNDWRRTTCIFTRRLKLIRQISGCGITFSGRGT